LVVYAAAPAPPRWRWPAPPNAGSPAPPKLGNPAAPKHRIPAPPRLGAPAPPFETIDVFVREINLDTFLYPFNNDYLLHRRINDPAMNE
jgi:hypothetical protein